MFEFLRNLYFLRKKRLTVLVMEETHPDEPLIHSITPQHIFVGVGTLALLLFLLIFGVVFFTPFGTLLLGREGLDMMENIQKLNGQVTALRDSVARRDRQINAFKNVVVRGRDTTFAVDQNLLVQAAGLPEESFEESEVSEGSEKAVTFELDDEDAPFPGTPEEEDPISGTFGLHVNHFPVEAPVKGIFSREFSIEKKHFGLDITAQEGSPVRALAEGVVVLAEWTLNYGYVIYVQHQGGWISGFKHCSGLTLKTGDVVSARDVIGTVGNTGLISSGPHLHVEIWYHGVPVDPAKFLIK